MLRRTLSLLRRGKPRPRAGMFPDKYRRVPQLLKPQQGGQQFFSQNLLRAANDDCVAQQTAKSLLEGNSIPYNNNNNGNVPFGAANMNEAMASATSHSAGGAAIHPQLPEMDLEEMMQRTTAEHHAAEMAQVISRDSFQTQRVFNERQWWESERERRMTGQEEAEQDVSNAGHSALSTEQRATRSDIAPSSSSSSILPSPQPQQEQASSASEMPERVLGADYFASRFGYSLLKSCGQQEGQSAGTVVTTDYAQLDLWGEMPKYHREMVFLYLISRRRNTYAVAYDYDGRRLLTTYTAGNRGLKGGDRGFRGDGSTDNGHQVTSMYLNDLLPKIREQRASQGRPMAREEKIDLVVRVMGFYNGRQGAIRAVQDRSSEYRVRYLEDITPFPLNGPKMPRGVFR